MQNHNHDDVSAYFKKRSCTWTQTFRKNGLWTFRKSEDYARIHSMWLKIRFFYKFEGVDLTIAFFLIAD